MAEEDVDIDDFIKMEIDVDDEDLLEWVLEGSFCYDKDPLLMLKPIVYTTRLDEMNAMKQNFRELNAKKIIEKLQSENKPIFTSESTHPSSNSGNLESFMKLSKVVNDINFKARLETHTRNIRKKNLLKQCKPLIIVLKDIKKTIPPTVTMQNKFQGEFDKTVSPKAIGEVQVKVEAIDSITNETDELGMKKGVIASSSSKVNEVEQKGSADEDDVALIKLKRKPVTSVALQPSLKKDALIVLLHRKGEVFVYRVVNSSKLVTDYFVTNEYDEIQLAAMYPKEEKIIVHYCCWYKREDVIRNICKKKNYTFSIQKFLRQPHSCRPGICECCCHTNNAESITNNQRQQKQIQKHDLRKSVGVTANWIRALLNRTNEPIGLVAKALSYVPKIEAKEKVVEKDPEKYAAFVLLCLKYSRANNTQNNFAELYEIGKNGNVVRSFLLNSYEKEKHVRRIYFLMGDVNIIEMSYCCWYKREQILHHLRNIKISPAAIKLMNVYVSHDCKKNKCKCCCKLRKVPMKAVQVLPTTLKHTTAYEKNLRPLTVSFVDTSKCAINNISDANKSSKTPKITNASTAAAATIPFNNSLKECCLKQSIKILSKFKNLKLGVTNSGKLEAILNVPAKKLSIDELKVLSDILVLSTKQITLFGIAPEEFCDRINSKSCPPNLADPKTSLISAPLSPQNLKNHSNDQIRLTASPLNHDKSTNDPLIQIPLTNLHKNIADKSIRKLVCSPQIQNALEPVRKTIMSIPKASSAKTIAVTFSSISHLMETKNKNYVDSFKSFFNNNVPYSVVMPEMNKFPHIPGLDTATDTQQKQASLLSLPKISDSFTLATSLTRPSDIAIPGSSGITSGPRKGSQKMVEINKVKAALVKSSSNTIPSLSVATNDNQTQAVRMATVKTYGKSIKRKAPEIDDNQINKKIRVKSISELIATKPPISEVAVSTNVQTQSIPNSPAPIILKRKPITKIVSILNSSKPSTTNNVVSSTSKHVMPVNAVFQLTENVMTKVGVASMPNNHSAGLRYLTLTPITKSKNNNVDNTILTQILNTPQVQPTTNTLPPLVPLSVNVGPVNEQKQVCDQNDVEESIMFNLIIDNTEQ